MFRARFWKNFGNFLGGNWWVLVQKGEFWLEDFHREDAKGAKVGYCQAGWFSDPWHGRLTRVFFVFGFGEPAAGAAGCWCGRGASRAPRRREG
jgi:hypothetical protein